MTTKVNVMVSLEVNRRGEVVEDDYWNVMVSLEVNRRGEGVEDDYQSECNGESGG